MPGIGNVTLRIRYYGLYAWLSWVYARRVGSTDPERWRRFVRRAEALYALIAYRRGSESGIATPASCCRRMPMICSFPNLDRFIVRLLLQGRILPKNGGVLRAQVNTSRTRFIPNTLLPHFDQVSWTSAKGEFMAAIPAVLKTRVDLAATVRNRWR